MRHFGVVVGVTSTLFLTAVGAASVAIARQPEATSSKAMGEELDASRAAVPDIAAIRAAAARSGGSERPEFPKFDTVVEKLTKVVSTIDGSRPLIDLYVDKAKGKVLGVLPSGYEKRLMMISPTISGGDPDSGVMGPTYYVRFKRYDKQIALVEPDFSVRTKGDAQAKTSIEQLYTGFVLAQTPIVSMAPGNRPVIDLSALGLRGASDFLGPSARLNSSLSKVTEAKAFPKNIVVEFEAPAARSGRMTKVTFAIDALEGSRGFKPRLADPRIGYFYNWHEDYAKPSDEQVIERYITRWNIEKADPKLKLSPPKRPLVWYIEHTTPIQYRRFVREGIEMWNEAFREIGIDGALVVYQQDAATGAHMDKDPEDARYNFFRWNASDQSYAIGPSRTNPLTGEILDADVVWHQGLTRQLRDSYGILASSMADEVFGPETLAWFEEHPSWDPRTRFTALRDATSRMDGLLAGVGADVGSLEVENTSARRNAWSARMMQQACQIGTGLSMDLSLATTALDAGLISVTPDEDGTIEMLDGVPAEFLGPTVRYISAHEVGHCLGLQHNMASSTIRTLEEINSPGFEGPMIGSVMEYAAANINYDAGPVQGPFATTEIGPYDKWAIAFGYGDPKKRKDILSRVAEPDLVWQSQIGTFVGGDPRNQTWDMGADNLNFAEQNLKIAADLRTRLVEEIVKDGESWSEVRRGYSDSIWPHVRGMNTASVYVGGTYNHNDFKGDPNGRPAIEDVPVEDQRRAMEMIINASFEDEAFGLTPEIVRHMGKQSWWDPAGMNELIEDPSFDVHNTVAGIQSLGLTMLMNPTTLRRVYDNEYRTEGDELTLAEVLETVTGNVWRECEAKSSDVEISSFRRNLQREHVGRMIDLSVYATNYANSPSAQTIGTLARAELRGVAKLAERSLRSASDPYAKAHLEETAERIEGALQAEYIVAP
ncbi:MAG: zinc-dependent metalloprotease [Planctomycetota bacterium]